MKKRRTGPTSSLATLAVAMLVLASWLAGHGAVSDRAQGEPKAVGQGMGREWSMLGGSPQRNLVNLVDRKLPDTWDAKNRKNVKWVAELGSHSYGGPVVAGGRIFIGTNNEAPRNPRDIAKPRQIDGKRIPVDKGILVCLREADGPVSLAGGS